MVKLILHVVDTLFWVYLLMLFARILVSWIPEWRGHRFVMFLSFYTDPYLNLFRRIIPPLGMIDLSPIVAIYALMVIEYLVKYLLVLVLR